MTFKCPHLLKVLALAFVASTPAMAQTLPSGIAKKDIGAVGLAGSVSYSSSKYTMKGAGADIAGSADAFFFLYGTLTGDGEITARVDSVTEPNLLTRVGVMIRKDLGAGAQNAYMFLHPNKGSAFQWRGSANGSTQTTWQETPSRSGDSWETPTPYRTRYLRPAKWLKSIRKGTTLSTYSSDDGLCWNLRWTHTTAFPTGTAYAGIALTSHDKTKLATAVISSFTVKNGAPAAINSACARTKVDGELAPPSTWVVKPTKAGGTDTWAISSVNPNPPQRPSSCLEGGALERRRYSDDEAICPAETLTAAWALPGYTYNTGSWLMSKRGAFGIAGRPLVGTPITERSLWLRKEITLTSTQLPQVVFWGRWQNGVSIYVNGVLATNVNQSELSGRYHYLGMNSRARAALRSGTNVLAVRVDCGNWCSELYTDFGVALHPKLGKYPVNVNATVPGSNNAKMAQIFADHTQEVAGLGGTYAFRQGGKAVEFLSLGWKDISLNTAMPTDPILRLASVDKRVTEAVIVKLYNENRLNPDAKVFSEVLRSVQPVPGKTWGNNVQNITVDQLRTHTSGISGIGGGQSWQDEVGFMFKVPASQINKHHLARVLASWDTDFVPGNPPPEGGYSSNGYFLLRYIAEVVTGKSLASYLLTDMGAENIVVAYERLEGRPAKEGGYMSFAGETRSRWFELEEYLALSASADGLGKFFLKYAPGYERIGNVFYPRSGGQGGAMEGTGSGGSADLEQQTSKVLIWNSNFPHSNRFDDRTAMVEYQLNPGSCDPRKSPGERFRINSFWQPDQYIHIEPLPSGGPSYLQSSPAKDFWESPKWRFNPVTVSGKTYYIIQNAWQGDQALQLVNGKLVSTSYNPSAASAQWFLHDSGTYFRLENRGAPGMFINIENGTLQATNLSEEMWSTRWYLCN